MQRVIRGCILLLVAATWLTAADQVAAQDVSTGSIAGTVTSAETGLPLADVLVSTCVMEVACTTEVTGADGTYLIDGLPPGDYEVTFWDLDGAHLTECYDGDTTFLDCTPVVVDGAPVDGIDADLEPWVEPTFGGSIAGTVTDEALEPIGGALVEACPAEGTFCESTYTDDEGDYTVTNLVPGSYEVRFIAPGHTGECYDDQPYSGPCDPVTVEDEEVTDGIDAALRESVRPCEPESPEDGLTNVGFETGDFTGWAIGTVTEEVAVTGADGYAVPYEGEYMARLGAPKASSGAPQVLGPNVICQDFVVDEPVERLVYDIFTYDYTGYDEFDFVAWVVDPDTNEILAAETLGAWGVGTELKTSGWRGIEIDLSGHVGETVRVQLEAGGTQDDLFGFWAYVDSADGGLPPSLSSTIEVGNGDASVMTDPVTGQVTVAMPFAAVADLPFSASPTCPDDSAPTAVSLLLDGTEFPMSEADGTWSVVIEAADVHSGVLSLQVSCEGEPEIVTVVGSIQLYDPSGYVTDATTGEPVEGAEVTLHQVPGWTAATEPGEPGPGECESNLSKEEGAPWSQPAPTALGVPANPYGGLISPQVNPFISNAEGYYGWDVAAGCWYVVVQAEGYDLLVSPVVGVPPEVTDLDLELMPAGATTAPAAPTNVVAVAGAGEATVSWTVPADNGGSPITGYTVTASPGGEQCTSTTTSCVVTGLTNGAAHTFTVVATNAVGDSPASAPSAPVTPTQCRDTPGTGPFPDVAANHQFCTHIEWLVASGVTGGYTDGTFKPTLPISRQGMAAFLYRYAGSPDGDDPQCSDDAFPDVPKAHGFCGEIAWMVEEGITGGFTDGTFRPGAPISRQSMAAFLYRFAGSPDGEDPQCGDDAFSDVPKAHGFCGEIAWMVEQHITEGYTDDTFRPGLAITRQGMAVFLYRFDEVSGTT